MTVCLASWLVRYSSGTLVSSLLACCLGELASQGSVLWGCFTARIQFHPAVEQQFRTANPTSYQWPNSLALQKAVHILNCTVPSLPRCSWPCAPRTQGSVKQSERASAPGPTPQPQGQKVLLEGHRSDKGWGGRVSEEPVRRAWRGCHL